jgi:hypothetical protein
VLIDGTLTAPARTMEDYARMHKGHELDFLALTDNHFNKE